MLYLPYITKIQHLSNIEKKIIEILFFCLIFCLTMKSFNFKSYKLAITKPLFFAKSQFYNDILKTPFVKIIPSTFS